MEGSLPRPSVFPSLSILPPSLRRPAVTWLGGAVFNPLVLGHHVWGKKRRDGHGLGRDSTREGKAGGGLYQGTLLASCLGLLKKFPNRPPPLSSVPLKIPPPSPIFTALETPSKEIPYVSCYSRLLLARDLFKDEVCCRSE